MTRPTASPSGDDQMAQEAGQSGARAPAAGFTARQLIEDNNQPGEPPAWEILNEWGGQVAIVFPYAMPCPPEILSPDIDARLIAHQMAAAPMLAEALAASKAADDHRLHCEERVCFECARLWGQSRRLTVAALAAARPPVATVGVGDGG